VLLALDAAAQMPIVEIALLRSLRIFRFHGVADGRLQVTIDGAPVHQRARRRHRRDRSGLRGAAHGDSDGHIPATVFALSREDFLAAVAGHTPTARAATEVADERRLEQDRPYQPSKPDDPQPEGASA
jgi:hypothetical protein